MANQLTGDFDLVVEFSVAGVNRVLAAMHANQRFPHSISVRVDDNPPPGMKITQPTVVGSVDSFGDAVVNQGQIGHPDPSRGALAATCPIDSILGQLINSGDLLGTVGTLIPSQLQGRAQLQLFPPTISVPDASGTNVTLSVEIMSRYLPDPNTSPLAEFMRGIVQITAAVNQITSETASVLEVDFKADQAEINFTPSWSSEPLSAPDLVGINRAIQNTLLTATLPSNITLPPGIEYAQVKTLPGSLGGIAVLLNTQGGPGTPASMNSDFLGAQDQFAFAVSPSYLNSAFQPIINNILAQPPISITIPVDLLFTTAHVVYSISLNSASFQLQAGRIVLTMQGHATQTSNKWYAPGSFDFTATFGFTLQADGSTADLIPLDVSLNTSSWVVNLFRGAATSGITQARDQALNQSGTYATVRNMLDANNNLGNFFNALLKPSSSVISFEQGQEILLAYTSVEIQPTGIILHGSITTVYLVVRFALGGGGTSATIYPSPGSWPEPYVEFEQIPPNTGRAVVGALPQGPNYSALKTWIPGGTIELYDWNIQGFLWNDAHRFIYTPPPPERNPEPLVAVLPSAAVPAFWPVCLTVLGTRLSPSCPVVSQPVTASV